MNEEQKFKKATYHLKTFLISKMVSALGANVYAFGMSMYILSLTGSAFSFAANLIFSIVPRIVFSPIAGVMGDRYSRKKLVIVGQLGEAAAITGLLIYSILFGLSLPAIYCTTVMYSVCSTFSSVAFSASLGNLVDGGRMQKAMSFNQISYSVSGIGGPIVGGLLFGFVSIQLFLIINIAALIITTALEATMNFTLFKREESPGEKEETMVGSLREGWYYIRKKPVIKSILFTGLWINLFLTCLNVGGDYVLLEQLKIRPQHIGIVEAAGAIGMLLTSIYFASRANVKNPLLFSKCAILGLSLLIAAFALPLIFSLSYPIVITFYAIAMLLFGSLGILTNTPILVMLQNTIDEEYRGRVFGILEMMAMGMMPVGTIIYGLLFDLVPAAYLFIGSGIILIGVTMICLNSGVIKQGKIALLNLKTDMTV